MTAAIPLTLTEAQFQTLVMDYAKLMGFMVCHYRPCQVRNGRWATPASGDVGGPDLILARDGTVWLWELKTTKGKLSAGQINWMRNIGGIGRVLRPENWNSGEIQRLLAKP